MNDPLPSRTDCVIVGAGLAGAAAAYGLAKAGLTDQVVLEREMVAGVHASGRNAAMAYSFIAEPTSRWLARRGRAFIASPPADFPLPLSNRFTGSLSLVDRDHLDAYAPLVAAMRDEGIPLQRWEADEIAARIPVLGNRPGEVGFYCPEDGVIDVDALLQGYLRAARRTGAALRFRCAAEELLVRDGRVRGVQTSAGTVLADRVVLAGGPWANDLAVAAGLASLPLQPARRHLAVVIDTEVPPDPSWPFVWHQTDPFYFRPESGGLLACACEVEYMAAADVGPDGEAVERLAEKTLAMLPGASGARIRRAWAGLRTLTPDEHFILGPDPRVAGLFWAAGLGGHGMTTSPAVAEVLADLMVRGRSDRLDVTPLLPERFL